MVYFSLFPISWMKQKTRREGKGELALPLRFSQCVQSADIYACLVPLLARYTFTPSSAPSAKLASGVPAAANKNGIFPHLPSIPIHYPVNDRENGQCDNKSCQRVFHEITPPFCRCCPFLSFSTAIPVTGPSANPAHLPGTPEACNTAASHHLLSSDLAADGPSYL